MADEKTLDYALGLIQNNLAAGETVFVDYSATWRGTCKRHGRIIDAARASNFIYDETMSFVKVDWDDYGRHEVTTSRNIPRRSTLIVLKGNEELGRIIAGTECEGLKALIGHSLLALSCYKRLKNNDNDDALY